MNTHDMLSTRTLLRVLVQRMLDKALDVWYYTAPVVASTAGFLVAGGLTAYAIIQTVRWYMGAMSY